MRKDPDFDLVRRCQSGERDAAETSFEELFKKYRDRVFNLASRLLGDHAYAEDVSQEAFVTVFRKIGEFRFSSRFYTWLYRVAYNLCMDHRRRPRDPVVSSLSAGEDGRGDTFESLADPETGPLEALAEGEYRTAVVERALRGLSRPLRVVVILRYMEDLQYSEIAEVLECSVGTVKSRLSRAHHFLQETLAPPEP